MKGTLCNYVVKLYGMHQLFLWINLYSAYLYTRRDALLWQPLTLLLILYIVQLDTWDIRNNKSVILIPYDCQIVVRIIKKLQSQLAKKPQL